MSDNPILREVRETRDRLWDEGGGTMAGLIAQLQTEEKLDRDRLVTYEQLQEILRQSRKQGKATGPELENSSKS
jgi:hypothetical protein